VRLQALWSGDRRYVFAGHEHAERSDAEHEIATARGTLAAPGEVGTQSVPEAA
jgi:hypothetical protein